MDRRVRHSPVLQGNTNKQVMIINSPKPNERPIYKVSKEGGEVFQKDSVTGLDISQGKPGKGLLGRSEDRSKDPEGATIWGMWDPQRATFCFNARKVKE